MNRLAPCIWCDQDALEAAKLYVSAFEGTVMFAAFELEGQGFMAADSAYPHGFTFGEGVSVLVYCHDQAGIDALWARLTDGGEAWPCGWLRDRFGVSWQIIPCNMQALADDTDPVRAGHVRAAPMQIPRIDIHSLRDAYEERTV